MPPPCITKLMPAGHRATATLKYVYAKAFEIYGSFHLGAPTGDAKLDAQVLLAGYPGSSRASQVKHVVFALDPKAGETEEQTIARYKKIIADWLAKYAPGYDWAVGLHRGTTQIHPHLVVAGFDKDGKPLRLLPHDVRDMAKMVYTQHARDATGIGTPGLGFYSKPRKPLIADAIRQATKEQLSGWIAQGRLRVGRVNKQGDISSIEFDPGDGKKPRRIRMDTIRRIGLRAGDDATALLTTLTGFLTQQQKPKESDTYGHTTPRKSRRSRNLHRHRNRQGHMDKRVARVR